MYRYIVIDDEPLIRKGVIKKLLPMKEVTCCAEASDGTTGIALIEAEHPDFVIMDMQMPIMNGMVLSAYLAQHYAQLPLVIISGYANFEYMRQAIASKAVDYILKPFSAEEIQRVVASITESLQNKETPAVHISLDQQDQEAALYQMDLELLEKMIMGWGVDTAVFHSQKLAFLNTAHHNMNVFTLFFHEADANPYPDSFLEVDPHTGSSVYIPSSRQKQFGFVLHVMPGMKTLQPSDVAYMARKYQLRFTAEQNHVLITASGTCAAFGKLNEAYLETTALLDTQRVDITGSQCLLQQTAATAVPLRWDKENEFLFRIESGAERETDALAEELFAWYAAVKGCTLGDVKRHGQYIASQCHAMLRHYQFAEGETLPELLLDTQGIVNSMYALADVSRYYRHLFANLAVTMHRKTVYNQNDLIGQVKTYITRNYQRDISQEFIASLFYVNRSYLSKLFRDKTNQKFVVFLNEVRINKAKEYLVQTDMKVFKVAHAVGYDNAKYFFRIFKLRTGFSPEQYREMHSKS